MIHVLRIKIVTLLFLIVACLIPIATQAQNEQCSAIIQQSLAVLRDTCNAVADNQGCYATGDIPEAFTETSSAFDLTSTPQVATSALSLENNTVGTALLKLHTADTPDIHLFLLGETTVENRSEEGQTAYQNLFMTTSSARDGCGMLDAMVAVYVPADQPAPLTINGASITIQGLISAHWLNANSLEIVVHQGVLVIEDANTVNAGLTISAITNMGDIIAWSAPYPSDAEQTLRGNLIADTVNAMMNTEIEVVESIEPTAEPTQPPVETAQCQNQVHTVQSGENLFRIALRYGVSQNSIISANQIANPDRISVGQQLVIPCDAAQTTTTTTTAPVVNNNNTQNTAPVVNELTNAENAVFCANFFANAPIGGYPPQIISLYNQLCP